MNNIVLESEPLQQNVLRADAANDTVEGAARIAANDAVEGATRIAASENNGEPQTKHIKVNAHYLRRVRPHPQNDAYCYTYGEHGLFEVPDVKTVYNFTGDFAWTGLSITKKENVFETFKANPALWSLFENQLGRPRPVKIGKVHDDGRCPFYLDFDRTIVWVCDITTGKIEICRGDIGQYVVADNIEEFWFREFVEANLWARCNFNARLKHLSKKQKAFLQNYAAFYGKHEIFPENENDDEEQNENDDDDD